MKVKIRIIGGAYYGTEWIGDIADAPVTMLIPEGIVSARTTEEADGQRVAIRRCLATATVVQIDAIKWSVRVTLIPEEAVKVKVKSEAICSKCESKKTHRCKTGDVGCWHCDDCGHTWLASKSFSRAKEPVEATEDEPEDVTYHCKCSWLGGDPDIGRGRRTRRGKLIKEPTCPACWKHDRKRVVVTTYRILT